MTDVQNQLAELIILFTRASTAIMNIYETDSAIVTIKDDDSPLTQADTASHHILNEGLASLFPDIPVISEEGDPKANKQLISSNHFWLVDPLDGTKEFIARNGEFVVCAGLIENGEPTFGIAMVPARGVTYYGGPQMGSYKLESGKDARQIHVADHPTNIIMTSRSHPSPQTATYISEHYPGFKTKILGSLLKFLEIAEGSADVFPRLDTAMKLWDVAAGHAILAGAGGTITRPDGTAIDYNNPTLLIGDFVARS